MFNLNDMVKITFLELRSTLITLTDKQEEYNQWTSEKVNAKKGDTSSSSSGPAQKRKFGELKNTKDLVKRCFNQKACAIALLPASTIIDYEEKNFNDQLALVEQLDKKAGNLPIHYQWVNATCHRDFVRSLDVDPLMLPTVVYYHPSAHKQAKLIGMFDEQTLKMHQDKFMNGRLPLYETIVPKDQLTLDNIDCKNIQIESVDEDDDFDEILAEILAEEAAREAEKEQDERAQSKKSSKKQKKKKKGKSEKTKVRDEL